MSRPVNSESVFRAIAHPSRRRMLQLLGDGELSAGEIVKQFRHTQPVISRHLRVLHEGGLVTMRRQGTQRRYRLAAKQLDPIRKWLNELETPSPSGRSA